MVSAGETVCRRYAFIYDDAMPSEVKELKAAAKKAKTPHEKRKAQVRMSQLQQSLKNHEDRKLLHQVRALIVRRSASDVAEIALRCTSMPPFLTI